MSVGENIKARRKQLHISAETIAEKLRCAPSTVYRWEKGDIDKVDADKLIIVAEILHTTPAALMGRDGNGASPERFVPQITPENDYTQIPDLEKAALKATEILIKHKISSAPILPMSILQAMPNVLIMTFTEFADKSGMDRDNMVTMFGAENQDVIAYAKGDNYYVAYNQRLPYYMLQRAMARELGHIVLGHHTSSLPEEVQTAEALFFMRYLLCPRPLLKALFDENIMLSVETLGNITGLYGRSLAGIRETPGAHIPAKMNRRIREQFAGYIDSIIEYMRVMSVDTTRSADFGTFMDNYEE